jgi:hypothetical protein
MQAVFGSLFLGGLRGRREEVDLDCLIGVQRWEYDHRDSNGASPVIRFL